MIKLRKITVQDTAACVQIEQLQPQAAGWELAGFETELKQKSAVIWGIFEGEDLIGFACARAAADSAEILNIAVHPSHTRKGMGRQLLEQLLGNLQQLGVREITLEVAQDNAAARALYARAGFNEVNKRKNFYGPGRDALLLRKDL